MVWVHGLWKRTLNLWWYICIFLQKHTIREAWWVKHAHTPHTHTHTHRVRTSWNKRSVLRVDCLERMTRACFPDTPGQCIPLGRVYKSEGSLPILLCFTVLGTQEHQEMTRSQTGESEMECMADWSQRHRVAVVQYSITLLPAVARYSKTSLPSVMVIALIPHKESNRSQKKVSNILMNNSIRPLSFV